MAVFNSVTSSVKVLGWLEKKKKVNDSGFQPFQVGHLRIVYDTLSATVHTAGAAYISCFQCF